jgi:3'-phosphoadenosine 5'-phosphosulfate sulfotransferase (PAPS reductase)/FAD synthetase
VYRRTARQVAEEGDLMDGMATASNRLSTLVDALHRLAQALGLDCDHPWRRLNAWAAFTERRAAVFALHGLADELNPVRLPIGYLTIHPGRHDPIDLAHVVVITTSGGKDSVVMEDVVCTRADQQDALHKVVAIHNSLGTTGPKFSNQPVEWTGTEELARRQTARYGIPFEVTHRPGGGLFDQLLNQRKKFPSADARWCTSDHKTNEGMKSARRHAGMAQQILGVDHVIVYYLVGLRAEESSGRARKPEFAIDRAQSTKSRTVIRWHPLIRWSEQQVWQHIKNRGLEYHWAYDAGMERLSCRLCVLATRAVVLCAARLSPELTADYVAAEEQLGHRFKNGLSMREIQDEARRLGPITDVIPGTAVDRHLVGATQTPRPSPCSA